DVERVVGVGTEGEVSELEAEAGAGEAVRPDLGVLAMAPFGVRPPLLGQVLGDLRVPPRERVLAVAHDVERRIPPRVAGDATMQPEHDEEETLEEEVAVGPDRVPLQTPRLDAV